MPYYRRNIIVLCVTVFLASVSWNQVVPFLPKFLEEIGGKTMSEKSLYYWVAMVAAVQSLAGMFIQPFWGKLGDTIGRKPMIIRAGICLSGIYLGMSICQAPWQLAIFRFLNGALTGFIPGSFALIATNTPERIAPRYVAAAQVSSSAGLIAGPVVGDFLAHLFGYRASMQVSGYAVILCTIAVWLLVREPNKTKATEKTSLVQDFGVALRSRVQLPIIVAVMLAWFYGSAITPYLVLYLESLQKNLPAGFTGLVFTLPAVAFVVTAPFWTSLGRKHGYHKTIIFGVTGSLVSFALMSFTPSIYTLAAAYLMAGIWLAGISPSTGALTCTVVDETFRGRAYAIQNSLGTFAALLAPMLAGLVADRLGMRWIFMMVAVVYLIGLQTFRTLTKHTGKEDNQSRKHER